LSSSPPLPNIFDTGNADTALSGDFGEIKAAPPSTGPVYIPPSPEGLPALSEDLSLEDDQGKLPEKPLYIPPPPSKEEKM
jgi:hypothetical protein